MDYSFNQTGSSIIRGDLERMKDTTGIYRKLLLRLKDIDGRVVILIGIAIYYLVFFAGLVLLDVNLMKSQGVPVMFPPFSDLRDITSALDSMRQGYDPMVNNPSDPWGRPLNYPRIWLLLEKLNISRDDTLLIGVVLAVVFYTCVVALLIPRENRSNVIIWLFAILSPAVTLAVERGNNDLIVFILLVLAQRGLENSNRLKSLLSYLLVLFAAVLKLFPVFAFCVFFRERRRTFIILLSIAGAFFLFYLAYIYDDLMLIAMTTGRSLHISYGNQIIFDCLQRKLLHSGIHVAPAAVRLIAWLFTIIVGVCGFLYLHKRNRNKLHLNANFIDGFRIGAGVYTGTFLLGYNYDYRLMFLLFTIPQLIQWAGQQKNKINLASVALFLLIATLWSGFYLKIMKLLLRSSLRIDELFNWALFVIFIYLLLITVGQKDRPAISEKS